MELLASVMNSSRGARIRPHMYSSRRPVPRGRESRIFFSDAARRDCTLVSVGGGSKDVIRGVREGWFWMRELRSVRREGLEREAAR